MRLQGHYNALDFLFGLKLVLSDKLSTLKLGFFNHSYFQFLHSQIKTCDLDFKHQFKKMFYSKLGHKIKKCALDLKLHFKNKFDRKTKAQKEEKILIMRISMIVS